MSIATTGWPTSAKQAAVTSPTQPTPTTPIGGFSFAFTVGEARRSIPIVYQWFSRIDVAIESISPSSSDCRSVLLTQ
jgi:hypothetical protein